MEKEFAKRKPAVECSLEELSLGSGQLVAVVCSVVSLNDELLEGIISDGTREAKVFFSNENALNACREAKTVRIIGKALVSGNGIQLNADFIQGLEGVDLEAYRKARAMEKKAYAGQGRI
ncbi:hypothetical protein HZB89_01975 [archaeon]|nr:hypothetical protein [archaeon]